jgi:hypothetical protein
VERLLLLEAIRSIRLLLPEHYNVLPLYLLMFLSLRAAAAVEEDGRASHTEEEVVVEGCYKEPCP